VGTLLGALQAQRDPPKIVRIHTPDCSTGEPIHQMMPHESTTPVAMSVRLIFGRILRGRARRQALW
jgi:hypothetical protein